MNTLRPGDYGVYSDASSTYSFRLQSKRIVELGTMVDATLYFLRKYDNHHNDHHHHHHRPMTSSSFLVVKVADFEASLLRYVEYPNASLIALQQREHTEEEIARDAFTPLDLGVARTPLGGHAAPDNGRAYEDVRRIYHEVVQPASATPPNNNNTATPQRRLQVHGDMTLDDFYKRVLLLPHHRRQEAIQQYVEEPIRFKENLAAQKDKYCANKSSMIRDVLFQYDYLSGALSARSFYINELCKTVLVFGECHDHAGSCNDMLPRTNRVVWATVGSIVGGLMRVLRGQEIRDDPPLLCMVESSHYNEGAHDLDYLDERESEDFHAWNLEDMSTTFMKAYRLDPRAAVSIDIRHELSLYVMGQFPRIPPRDDDEKFFLVKSIRFLTRDLPLVVHEFLPLRNVFQLVPRRVQKFIEAYLEERMHAHRQDDIIRWGLKESKDAPTMSERIEHVADIMFELLTRLMDMYTVCKIVSSTQNLIVVHVGEKHAQHLQTLLERLFVVDEKMELTSNDFVDRLKNAYFLHNYKDEFMEYLRTHDEAVLERNADFYVDMFVAKHVHGFSCLPLSNKDDLFATFMEKIRRGDSFIDVFDFQSVGSKLLRVKRATEVLIKARQKLEVYMPRKRNFQDDDDDDDSDTQGNPLKRGKNNPYLD